MAERFDAIVVGGGAMGTAAARNLAMRGRHTLLLERFTFGHGRGSSGGPTRIFRLTYHDPLYVRMARSALETWKELEDAAGEPLMIPTAGLDVGELGRESADALAAAGETCEYLTSDAVTERWPALRFPAGAEIFVQEDGGVCLAEGTVLTQARLAEALGATVKQETAAAAITAVGDGVEVVTAVGAFRAPVAVVSAGPWAAPLLSTAGIDLPLVPSFEQVTYYEMDGSQEAQQLPTVIDWMPNRVNTPYIVPDPVRAGHFKVGLHASGPPVDAETRPFDPDPDRVARSHAYTSEHVTGYRDIGRTDTCLYTNTPDEDLVVDRVGPIVIASPCSGHGFKFVPLMGRVLADLATGETPTVPLDRFRADRPGLR